MDTENLGSDYQLLFGSTDNCDELEQDFQLSASTQSKHFKIFETLVNIQLLFSGLSLEATNGRRGERGRQCRHHRSATAVVKDTTIKNNDDINEDSESDGDGAGADDYFSYEVRKISSRKNQRAAFKLRVADFGLSSPARFGQLIIRFCSIYGIVKSLLVAMIQYKFDTLFSELRPLVRYGANRTERCALKEDIYFATKRGQEISDHVLQLAYWNSIFCSPFPSIRGSGVTVVLVLGLIPVFFFFLGLIVLRRRSACIDWLAFALNPVCERHRMRAELANLVYGLSMEANGRNKTKSRAPSKWKFCSEHNFYNRKRQIGIKSYEVALANKKLKSTNDVLTEKSIRNRSVSWSKSNEGSISITVNELNNNDNMNKLDYNPQTMNQQTIHHSCSLSSTRNITSELFHGVDNSRISLTGTYSNFNPKFNRPQNSIVSLGWPVKLCEHRRYQRGHLLLEETAKANQQRISRADSLIGAYVLDLVRPIVLTPDWHQQTARVYISITLVQVALWVTTLIVGTLSLTLVEFSLKAKHQLQLFECHKWNPNSTLIMDYIFLFPLIHQSEIDAFLSYNDKTSSKFDFLYLVFIEYKRFLTVPRYWLLVLEASFFYVFFVNWITFYSSLWIMSIRDKFAWLCQVIAQLDYCSSLGVTASKLSDGHSILDPKQYIAHHHHYDDDSNNNLSDRLITISYLNFALLHRRQKRWKLMANFLLAQTTIPVALIIILCYLVGTTIRTKNNLVHLLTSASVAILLNVYLVTGAPFAGKVEKLMKSILRLVVSEQSLKNSNADEENESFAVNLWRRQILSASAAHIYFAPNVLGVHLAYDKLITMNAYLVGLWLVLLR